MEEMYKSNSHKSKQEAVERKKVERVVSGPVRVKKKSGVSKFFAKFIGDETTNLKTYVVKDIAIPAVKDAISKIVDMVLFGDTRRSRSMSSKVSYRSYYDERRGDRFSDNRRQEETRYSNTYEDVIVSTRKEAEDVLSQLQDIIDTYDVARVADLYEMVGITGNYTDNNYGWENVSDARVVPVRGGGYCIEMPKARVLKR